MAYVFLIFVGLAIYGGLTLAEKFFNDPAPAAQESRGADPAPVNTTEYVAPPPPPEKPASYYAPPAVVPPPVMKTKITGYAGAVEDESFLPDNFTESTANAVLDAAASAVGGQLSEIPSTGCSESLLSADKVMTMLDYIPIEQRTPLIQALNLSSPVWSAQVYTGSQGVGFCLPASNRLLVLPMASAVKNVTPSTILDLVKKF